MNSNKNNLKYIKLQVEVPKKIWIAKLSKKFPEEIFTLNYPNHLSLIEREVFLSTISKKNINEIFEYLLSEPQVKNVEKYGNNIKLIFKLDFLQELLKQKITIFFPVLISNGYGVLEVFANKTHVELFSKVFRKVKILRIAESFDKKEELSHKQKEVLETAYMLGYFSYPRKISLTELAKHLKISKATLSENLRIAENKIISNYFNKLK